jgi:hypothetical protein
LALLESLRVDEFLQQRRTAMRFDRLSTMTARHASSGIVVLLTLPCFGQQPAGKAKSDRTKEEVVESTTNKIVRDSAGVATNRPGFPDGGKMRIETPTKKALATASANAATPAAGSEANPTVRAGDVHWHKSFADACTAAKKSGKPVLLFHMMGQLDKQFC